jgi:hypothetical protein
LIVVVLMIVVVLRPVVFFYEHFYEHGLASSPPLPKPQCARIPPKPPKPRRHRRHGNAKRAPQMAGSSRAGA